MVFTPVYVVFIRILINLSTTYLCCQQYFEYSNGRLTHTNEPPEYPGQFNVQFETVRFGSTAAPQGPIISATAVECKAAIRLLFPTTEI